MPFTLVNNSVAPPRARRGLVRKPVQIAVVVVLGSVAAWGTNLDVQWDNGAGNNDWGNPTNWSGDVLPSTGTGTNGDKIHINLGGANRAVYAAADGTNTYQLIRVGDAASGGELEVTDGQLASDGTAPTRIATGGRTASYVQAGGAVSFGGYLEVGLDANSVGSIMLSGGTLISARNGTVGGIPGVSLDLGDGSNARGSFILSGGEFRTRTGVVLGNPATTGQGRFEVDGAGIANIGTENSADDGFWVQSSNSVLAAYVADGALGTIYVAAPSRTGGTYANGNVIFMPGSQLEAGFLGPPTPGSWDVMHWDGGLLTNGLAFAPDVTDTNWHFAFVDTDGLNGPDTLRLSYGTPPPTAFVHPGGLNTAADFARMRAKVAAGAQPWVGGWNRLIANPHAQLAWTPRPQGQIVRAGNTAVWTNNYSILYNDIAAAYQCALRYQVSEDPNYANKAVQIMNAWANTLTNLNGDSDRYLAAGIYGYEFANAGEMMSRYGGWKNPDKAAFKAMMLNVFYPLNHEFLLYHNNACITHYWANWDLCNLASIISIAVLCDDPARFNEAVDYFKTGIGNGSIGHAVYYVHPGGLGQWQESGRDQGHATLGMALMGPLCQVAWNQGVDLYGYAGNRFLAGCEYVAKYNLTNPVPYVTYNNCDNVNQTVISSSGRGSIRPCWEMIYNHYVNLMGLTAPYTAQFASLVRPEGGGGDYGPNSGGYDQLGFGTLAYTIDPGGAVPPGIPAAPTGLRATASCGEVQLSWNGVPGATGYNVMRSTLSGGPYTNLIALNVAGTNYTDATAINGTTYDYVVSAVNAGGESPMSSEAGATAMAGALSAPWTSVDVGAVGLAGSANYCDRTFTLQGAGADIGGTADSFQFAWTTLTNNGELVARWTFMQPGGDADKVGLMMRETTAPGSRAVALLYDDNSSFKRVRMPVRTSANGSTTYPGPDGPTGMSVPLWLRLARTNDVFSGYVSTDGAFWTPVATVTNAGLSSTLLAGLAVCSRNTNSPDVSTFDHVMDVGVWPSISLAPPRLVWSLSNNQLEFNWPADHTGWRLEAQTNSLGTNWFTILGSTATNLYTVPLDTAGGSVFYRLIYP